MKKILIIEDDSAIAEIEKITSRFPAWMRQSSLMEKGLEEAQSGLYDLILLDLMLPGTDGFFHLPHAAGTTGYSHPHRQCRRDDIDKIRSLGFGADDYIEKPFSPAVLAARVKSQLARYERLKGRQRKIPASSRSVISL